MNPDTRTPPPPAPLPYSSKAGRGEIPAAPPAPTVDRDDPDAPHLRDDDWSFWISVGFVAYFIILTTVIASIWLV